MPSETAPTLSRPEGASARTTELRGLVDNATPDRLYGWVWNASAPDERVVVEIRLGSEVVFRTVADFARPDLAKAGIGDGCHAFEIPLQPEWIRRRADLAVLARAADGTEMPVPVRIPRPAAEEQPLSDGGLQRAVEAVAAGQRRLHEDIRSIAARVPEGGDRGQLDSLLRTQGQLAEKVETLTLWMTRLDERLAALPTPAPAVRPRRRQGGWTIVLVLVLVAAGVAALAVAGGLAR
ncbi:hypothetical protein GWK16_19335 [Roseomonas sp. JC162]|uniref:Uncharacterized protein n=1 Tax=Neoroseomonas marina TaxID=1232220 RepID=A0A848EG42_9PROT|nr:hypothetical protein [Neoroseomonas marina]NMJ43411.1 hypothetical protein [Neoroseomonas marina]